MNPYQISHTRENIVEQVSSIADTAGYEKQSVRSWIFSIRKQNEGNGVQSKSV